MNFSTTTTASATAFVYEEALIDGLESGASPYPDPELLELLRELATRSAADVHVISGLDRAVLGQWFDMVPVTIWAEDLPAFAARLRNGGDRGHHLAAVGLADDRQD